MRVELFAEHEFGRFFRVAVGELQRGDHRLARVRGKHLAHFRNLFAVVCCRRRQSTTTTIASTAKKSAQNVSRTTCDLDRFSTRQQRDTRQQLPTHANHRHVDAL